MGLFTFDRRIDVREAGLSFLAPSAGVSPTGMTVNRSVASSKKETRRPSRFCSLLSPRLYVRRNAEAISITESFHSTAEPLHPCGTEGVTAEFGNVVCIAHMWVTSGTVTTVWCRFDCGSCQRLQLILESGRGTVCHRRSLLVSVVANTDRREGSASRFDVPAGCVGDFLRSRCVPIFSHRMRSSDAIL